MDYCNFDNSPEFNARLDATDNLKLDRFTRKEILRLHFDGHTVSQICDELDLKRHQVRAVVDPGYTNHGRGSAPEVVKKEEEVLVDKQQDGPDQLLEALVKAKEAGISISEGIPEESLAALERRGHHVILSHGRLRLVRTPEAHVNQEPVYDAFDPSRQWHGFAVITDSHFGGYQAQPWFIQEVAEEAARRKYAFMAHAGDHVDGPPAMHKGFEFELGLTEADEQVDFTASLYRSLPIRLIGIGGNHDGSHYKAVGLDVVRLIAERSDGNFTYIGPIEGWIAGPNDDPNFMRLFHPGDGCSYALSYKDQKMAEYLTLENDRVPTGFHFTGHYHKYNNMVGPNGAYYFLAPSTCAQTKFMRAKKLLNQAGALFIEFTLDKKGKVDRVKFEHVQLHPSEYRRCDYSNYKSLATKSKTSAKIWG